MRKVAAAGLIAALAGFSAPSAAQNAVRRPSPAVGQMAPDFTISAVTRYGKLKNPVKLSDFRGSTVVLAFFYQARTKG